MPNLWNLVALVAVPLAEAHFSFVRIAHNDVWAEPLQYIRNKTTPFQEISYPYARLFNYPTYNIDSPESIRCGRDSFKSAAITETLTIKAGDKLEIAATTLEPSDWTSSHFNNCPDNRGICTVEGNPLSANIIHDGPLIVHLSAVPDNSSLEKYDGSGEWVKIFSMGVELRDNGALHWLPRNLGPNYEIPMPPHLIFHVPKETPAGDYLLRLDFIYPGLKGADSSPQLYPACVHLRVESDAKGHLPEGVLIPEIFSGSAKGLLVSVDMYDGQKLDPDFVYGGGPIWDGSKLKEDAP